MSGGQEAKLTKEAQLIRSLNELSRLISSSMTGRRGHPERAAVMIIPAYQPPHAAGDVLRCSSSRPYLCL